jgi:hypothetical protein
METFVNRVELQAKLGEQGARAAEALAVSHGVWLCQLAGDGLALEATAEATKYCGTKP